MGIHTHPLFLESVLVAYSGGSLNSRMFQPIGDFSIRRLQWQCI